LLQLDRDPVKLGQTSIAGTLGRGFVAVLALSTTTAHAGQTLDIAVLDNSVLGAAAQGVLERAYAKLGIGLRTHLVPLRRGVQMADAGELDGDLMHTAVSLKEWPGLVMINVPVARAVFSAYRLGGCPDRITIDQLAGKRVSYMRGTRGVEVLLPAQALLATNNNWDAIRHVRRGIADYAVVGQAETDALLQKTGAREICKIAEPVATANLFHSLNVKHAELAARLEAMLRDMANQGEIKRIWAEETARAQAALAAPTP
jgi:polar amino acid transport system substrate-binding protein